ncbi:MAG: DUF1194 domain-containing protein [Hyphomicrobiales bacterium]
MTWRGPAILLAASALFLAPAAGRSAPARTQVDLELVLAVDVSLSMDVREQLLQREGYAAAFRHPDIINAIRAGRTGRIAVTYVEWSSKYLQWIAVPWMVIEDEATGDAFAQKIVKAWHIQRDYTSISDALMFASTLFLSNDYDGDRQVIDISGDGPNNNGIPVETARDAVVAAGITINGLPILPAADRPIGYFDIRDIDTYYQDCVIGGPGAFIVSVGSRKEFGTAIRRKLLLEIVDAGGIMPASVVQMEHHSDCMVGERALKEWLDGGRDE